MLVIIRLIDFGAQSHKKRGITDTAHCGATRIVTSRSTHLQFINTGVNDSGSFFARGITPLSPYHTYLRPCLFTFIRAGHITYEHISSPILRTTQPSSKPPPPTAKLGSRGSHSFSLSSYPWVHRFTLGHWTRTCSPPA